MAKDYTASSPSDLKITDMRFFEIDGAPKRCTLKIADIADENGVAVAIHMAESPVACLAAAHTAAAMHNVLAMEFHSVDVPWWSDMISGLDRPLIENGFIHVPDKPGLGFEALNEEVLLQHSNKNINDTWNETGRWDKEFSNDRIWS
jgi:hypothetical protein